MAIALVMLLRPSFKCFKLLCVYAFCLSVFFFSFLVCLPLYLGLFPKPIYLFPWLMMDCVLCILVLLGFRRLDTIFCWRIHLYLYSVLISKFVWNTVLVLKKITTLLINLETYPPCMAWVITLLLVYFPHLGK
jgi:hypothetical protein